MKHDGPGRPAFRAKPLQRLTVTNMSIAGIVHERIAECFDIDRKTLEKHFARELKVGKDEVTGRCVGKIVEAIDRGEAWAICFYLKTRCGWKETQVTEHAGEVSVNSNASELLASRVASIAARIREDSGVKDPE